jgi:hypothetical protein
MRYSHPQHVPIPIFDDSVVTREALSDICRPFRFAVKAGAKHVIGVDFSTIIEKAKEIVHVNGMSDKITLLQGKMEDVKLPFPKVDIIISEWMDSSSQTRPQFSWQESRMESTRTRRLDVSLIGSLTKKTNADIDDKSGIMSGDSTTHHSSTPLSPNHSSIQ